MLGGVQGPFLQLLLNVETFLRVEKPKSEPVETAELVHPDSAQWSLDSDQHDSVPAAVIVQTAVGAAATQT